MRSESGEIRTGLVKGDFSENPQTGQIMTVLLEWCFGELHTCYTPSSGYEDTPGFHCDCRDVDFQVYSDDGMRGVGVGQVQNVIKLFLLNFSLKQKGTPWLVTSLWLISRVMKKLILTIFASTFIVEQFLLSLLLWSTDFSELLTLLFSLTSLQFNRFWSKV